MKPEFSSVERFRVTQGPYASEPKDRFGAFVIPHPARHQTTIILIVDDGSLTGWEHVSVSLRMGNKGGKGRIPSWLDMAWIKSLFWLPTETVMQLHVPTEDHVNDCEFCLHLWRPTQIEIPRPPSNLVGIKKVCHQDPE